MFTSLGKQCIFIIAKWLQNLLLGIRLWETAKPATATAGSEGLQIQRQPQPQPALIFKYWDAISRSSFAIVASFSTLVNLVSYTTIQLFLFLSKKPFHINKITPKSTARDAQAGSFGDSREIYQHAGSFGDSRERSSSWELRRQPREISAIVSHFSNIECLLQLLLVSILW